MSERFLTTVIFRIAREICLKEFRRSFEELFRLLVRNRIFRQSLLEFGIESVF